MRSIPDPGFAGDAGAPDPALTQALRNYSGDKHLAPVLAALCTARVLVPVVAVRGDTVGDDDRSGGTAADGTDMAAMLMTGRDGRRALLAFTGTDPLSSWDPQARPVPVAAAHAAAAARDEHAVALLLDPAGPVAVVVEGEDLRRLAAGERLVPVGTGWGWVPQVPQ